MPERDAAAAPTALRGPALTFTGDPFVAGVEATMRYESDAIVAMAGGKITHFGPASTLRAALPPGIHIYECGRDALILPGFIDCHVHYPQTQIIGAYGEQLLDWLEKYTFVAEQQFADVAHARAVANVFLDECLRHGATTVASCHAHSPARWQNSAVAKGGRQDRPPAWKGPGCRPSARCALARHVSTRRRYARRPAEA